MKNSNVRFLQALYKTGIAVACTTALAGYSLAGPQVRGASYELNIPAQDLRSALQEVAATSHHKLMYKDALVAGKTSAPINGTFTAEEAIRTALMGTELSFEITTDDVVLIRDKESESASGLFRTTNAEGDSRLALNSENAPATDGQSVPSSSEDMKKLMIQEIVVTAQKREQSLQDVPISISVLSGEALDASRMVNIRGALDSVPSMDFGFDEFTRSSVISVRGVGNGAPRGGGSSTTAYYLDGTSFGHVRSAVVPMDADLYDLERIEVLRGPQGTLYGANSLNGVIRVLTKNASTTAFELKGRTFLSSTQDGGGNYGGNLAINVPLIQDKLAVRAVIGTRHDSGWIESPIDHNVNSTKLQSYRLKVRAEPSETLTIDLSAWHSNSSSDAPALSDDEMQITSVQDQAGETQYEVFGAEIIKDFGAFSVSSMTSYIDSKEFGRFDGTPAGALLALEIGLTSKIFTEELNVVSQHGGPWRWALGAFYRDAKDESFDLRDWHPPLDAIFGDTTVSDDFRDTSESFAVYGELGRRFFDDKLELSAGLRHFYDKQSLRLLSPYLPLPLTPIRSSAEATTPRVVLTWAPESTSAFYASYSQGFRSGLGQAPSVQVVAPNFPPAEPDKLHNYEVGAKGSLLNGGLSYEGAVYYIDWQGVQQPVQVILIAGSLVTTAVVNSGSASGLGAEFSLSAQPTDGLELHADFSWNDLTFDSAVVEDSGRILFPKGGRLVQSPKYTAGAFARYSFPLGGGGLTGALEISGSYKSEQTWYFLVASGQAGSGNNPFVPTLGDTRFNGGSAVFSIAARDRWSARLFVDNITNEYRTQKGIALTGTPAALEWRERQRPRTVGLQLEYVFK